MNGERHPAIEERFASEVKPSITATGDHVVEFMIYDGRGRWVSSASCPSTWLQPTAVADPWFLVAWDDATELAKENG